MSSFLLVKTLSLKIIKPITYILIHKDRQADRQTDRQTDRQKFNKSTILIVLFELRYAVVLFKNKFEFGRFKEVMFSELNYLNNRIVKAVIDL